MTPKQLRFVDEYLIDLNATKAAKRAGYSAKTAGQIGEQQLKKPEIAKAIAKALEEQSNRTLISADQVLLDIERIGRKAEKASDFANALKSRELLGRRYKLFTDRVEVQNTVPRAERLHAARARRKKV
jgi:predicted house-cleaning NTP pyrophosphatase (Maf/HAM1 superfamily)